MNESHKGRTAAPPRYKTCETCGKTFCDTHTLADGRLYKIRVKKFNEQRFCQRDCRRWGRRDQFKKCKACGQQYSDTKRDLHGKKTRKIHAAKFARSQWCSTPCRWATESTATLYKACEWCGNKFSNRYKTGVVMGARFLARRVCSVSCKNFLEQHKTVKEKFLNNVGKQRKDSCLYWNGTRTRFGHGRIELKQANGKGILAHRLSYALFVGPVPATRFCCHTCDVPQCVNPKHLYLGDYITNGADRARTPRPPAADMEERGFNGIEVTDDDRVILTNVEGQIIDHIPPGRRGEKVKQRLRKPRATHP